MHIRMLGPWDRDAITAFYLSLDAADRRMRFCGAAGDAFIAEYGRRLHWMNTTVLGAFDQDRLCGLVELVRQPDVWPFEAEVAISVAPGWRRRGVGRALLRHALSIARNRCLARVRLYCLPENRAMQALARSFEATIAMRSGEAEGQIRTPWPNAATLIDEASCEANAVMQAAFDVSLPRAPTAEVAA